MRYDNAATSEMLSRQDNSMIESVARAIASGHGANIEMVYKNLRFQI